MAGLADLFERPNKKSEEDRAARHAQVRRNGNISGEESFEVMQRPSEISVPTGDDRRILKYEDIYLNRYETVNDLKAGVDAYFRYYNSERFHQSLDYNVPDEMYECFQYDVLEKAA